MIIYINNKVNLLSFCSLNANGGGFQKFSTGR